MTLQFVGTFEFRRSKYKEAHQPAFFDKAQRRLENVFLASGDVLESVAAGINADALEKTVTAIA
jgi:hypothetical protein